MDPADLVEYAARLVEEHRNPPNDWEASPLDDPAAPECWWWWLKTTWQKHRYTAVELRPLLVRLDAARGHTFMTVEHVVAVLDTRDPEALVRRWIGGTSGRVGLPERSCAWTEGGEPCARPARAVNARYCAIHATSNAKARYRRYNRKRGDPGEPQSRPSLALPNQGSAAAGPPHPAISVFPWGPEGSLYLERAGGDNG